MERVKAKIIVEVDLDLDPTNYDIDGVVTPQKVLAAEKALIEEDLNENTGYLIESIGFAAENGDFTFKSIELKEQHANG